MSVVVVGLNERDVPLSLIERVSLSEGDLDKALDELLGSPHLDEAVIVSTCMRTEVYAVLERFHDGLLDIRTFFGSRVGDSAAGAEALDAALFVAYDDAAVAHLFEVAAGIDSAVLGEGEILRQVRQAAEAAAQVGACGPVLSELFRHATEVGKRTRTETAIARGPTSLAHVAVEVAAGEFDDGLVDRHVIVVGAGEMGEAIATGAKRRGARVVLANRSPTSAAAVAARIGPLETIGLERLAEALVSADACICATAAPGFLLEPEMLAGTRRRNRLVVVDAAVPRDVDPLVAELAGVVHFDLDDLRAFADEQMAERRAEIAPARAIISDELERYKQAARGRSFGSLIERLYATAEQLRLESIERLGPLSANERALVERETRQVVRKLLHKPVVELKAAAGTPRGERLAEALRSLFEL